MQQHSDEFLVAFLDGELDARNAAAIETQMEGDAALRQRLVRLSESAVLLREVFAPVLDEAMPERLLAVIGLEGTGAGQDAASPSGAAARGAGLLSRARKRISAAFEIRPWRIGLVAAASLAGMALFTSAGYFAGVDTVPAENSTAPTGGDVQANASSGWLDNVAGYHNLFISSANGAETPVFDVPAGAEKRLPVDIRVPDLKAYGLAFKGARKIVLDGKPAYQFFYGGDRPVAATTLFITNSAKPEMAPVFVRRSDVNMIYWRHLGHAYALVAQGDKGWMSGVANDAAFQLQNRH